MFDRVVHSFLGDSEEMTGYAVVVHINLCGRIKDALDLFVLAHASGQFTQSFNESTGTEMNGRQAASK